MTERVGDGRRRDAALRVRARKPAHAAKTGLLWADTSYIFTNISLFAFNILPVPPLDGSRLIEVLLPGSAAAALFRIERFGILIVYMIVKTPWFDRYMEAIHSFVLELIRASI